MSDTATSKWAPVKLAAAVIAIIGLAVTVAGIAYGFMPTGIGCGSGFSPEGGFGSEGCEIATTDRKAVAWTLIIPGVLLMIAAAVLAGSATGLPGSEPLPSAFKYQQPVTTTDEETKP